MLSKAVDDPTNLEDSFMKELALWGKLGFGFLVLLSLHRFAVDSCCLVRNGVQGSRRRRLDLRTRLLWNFN